MISYIIHDLTYVVWEKDDVILVQDAKDKDYTLGIRISSAYHSILNLATLLCFPFSTLPSSNSFFTRHIAHHIPLLPVHPQPQAMADPKGKGKGKEVERELTVTEGRINSLFVPNCTRRIATRDKLLPCGKLAKMLRRVAFLL